MRRIDLFCKLLGPLAIALIAAASVPVAVYTTLGMSLASVIVEYACIEMVCTSQAVHIMYGSAHDLLRCSAGFQLCVDH